MGLLDGFLININSKDNPKGQLAAKHYMPLVQKLTGKAYQSILRDIYKLGIDYDFSKDPQGVKTKRVRKNTVRVLTDKIVKGLLT
jgi:hypothetical protein